MTRYVRRQLPHTVVTVISRKRGRVTYRMHETELTISKQSFKEIYRRVRRWQS